MKVTDFSEIAEVFMERVNGIVWCNAATIDRANRPRSRVLHPIWELVDGLPVGWIATGRDSLKAKHLAHRPYLSLAYVADPFKPAYAECHAHWADDPATKQRIWQWFTNTPPPLGYDPTPFFKAMDSPTYGVLKLTPWRIEVGDLLTGQFRAWQPN